MSDKRIEQMIDNAKQESIGTPGYKLALVCEELHERIIDLERKIECLKQPIRPQASSYGDFTMY